MSRLNLARKYRPQQLSEVMGQVTAVKVLTEAIRSDRIAPAYLFFGPRGTGKTTSARIFARAAACLDPNFEKRPCGECRSCKSQSRAQGTGQSMDLIEIDGASHTGVDDVRSIVEAVAYRPSVGRRTVYIIDEVHMLSNAAFNALLKTLEEPPAHALFLLATTEPEKLPGTILSRVQKIEMRRLKEAEIIQNLSSICKKEKIKFDPGLLEHIAAAADGSLRDAQTLLEQVTLLSSSQDEVSSEAVDSFLGTIGHKQEIEVLGFIAENQNSALLTKINQFHSQGKDLVRLLERLVRWARALVLLKAADAQKLLQEDFTEEHLVCLKKIFQSWSLDEVDSLFEIFWLGYERIRKSEMPKIILETTLLRATRIPELVESVAPAKTQDVRVPILNPVAASAPSPKRNFTPPPTMQPPTPAPLEDGPVTIATNTQDLLAAIKRRRPPLHALMICSSKAEWKEKTLNLYFPSGHFAIRQLTNEPLVSELQGLVNTFTQSKCTGVEIHENSDAPKTPKPAKVDFMKEAKKSIVNDPAIQKAAEMLGAKIESVTIEGVKNP